MGREGWSEGKRTDGPAGRRGADQFSPPADQSCPLTLSVSADDTLSLPIGPFPGQEREEKKTKKNKKEGGGVRIRLEGAGWCVRACVGRAGGRERENTHSRGLSELASVKLSSPSGLGASRREAPQVSSTPPPLRPPPPPERASGGGCIQSLVSA